MATVKISDKLYEELQQLIQHWDSPASPDELVELALDNFLTEHWPDQETDPVELTPEELAGIREAEDEDEANDTPLDEVMKRQKARLEANYRTRKVSA